MEKLVYLLDELMTLNDAEITRIFQGKLITIIKNDDTQVRGGVIGFIRACNPPHLYCGFILSEDCHIGFGSIRRVELV